MTHVMTIRLQGGDHSVMVVATMMDGEEVVIKDCDSGGEARDWLKKLLASINERGFEK